MRRHVLVLSAAILVALPTSPASAAPKGGPSKVVQPDLIVEWRRDVWQDVDLRAVSLDGPTASLVTGVKRGGRPRWSPDGSRVAGYLKAHGAGATAWEVALMSAGQDGRGERVIVTAPAFDQYNVGRGLLSAGELGYMAPFDRGSWSPDGTSFVFSGQVRYPRRDPAVSSDDLFVFRLFAIDVASDGSGIVSTLREVLPPNDAGHDDFDPTWSSNGWLVFVRATVADTTEYSGGRTGQRELWAARPDSPSTLQRLSDFAAAEPAYPGVNTPAWNPAGTRIAVSGNLNPDGADVGGDLWLLDVAAATTSIAVTGTTTIRGTSAASATEWMPTWSPDGGAVAFIERSSANDRQVASRLILHSVSTGSERVLLSSTKQGIYLPDWNPRGRNAASATVASRENVG